jgi:diphthamide synthase (EF-2-diphthine--ammonia ligase)
MLQDHVGLPVHPVLISAGDGSCLAVFSVKKKGEDVTYFDAMHLSDPEFFAAHAQAIADTLREEITQIVGYELEDPRLAMVTVTDVRVADDLRDASVFVTVAGAPDAVDANRWGQRSCHPVGRQARE